MIAKTYGQDPRAVALWEPDWIAAALTAMAAENGADAERAKRAERKRRQKGGA